MTTMMTIMVMIVMIIVIVNKIDHNNRHPFKSAASSAGQDSLRCFACSGEC